MPRKREFTPEHVRVALKVLRKNPKDMAAQNVIAKQYYETIMKPALRRAEDTARLHLIKTVPKIMRSYRMTGEHGSHFGEYLYGQINDEVNWMIECVVKREKKHGTA